MHPQAKGLGLTLLALGLLAAALLVPSLSGEGEPALLRLVFGWGAYGVAAALVLGGLLLLLRPMLGRRIPWIALALAELAGLLILTLIHLASGRSRLQAALAGEGGGLLGWAGSELLVVVAGEVGAVLLALAFLALTVWLLVRRIDLSWPRSIGPFVHGEAHAAGPGVPRQGLHLWAMVALCGFLGWSFRLAGRVGGSQPDGAPESGRDAMTAPPGTAVDGANPARLPNPIGGRAPTPARRIPIIGLSGANGLTGTRARAAPVRQRPSTLPPLDLLKQDQSNGSTNADTRHRAQLLKDTLAEFGVPVEVVSIKEGPTVTQFGLEPGETVRELRSGEFQRRRVSVRSILQLQNDLALALAASSIRMEAPVPGRPYVGVEVPNTAKTLVSLRGVLESKEFSKTGSPLAVALGRDVSGDPVVTDLAQLPHLLIAGATGSGKSVCINAMVCSLLLSSGPERVRLLMVDPKMVELPAYDGIPHLLGKVITDAAQVPAALSWLMLQMDERYRLFADGGVRNIAQYNRKYARSRDVEQLPYIVLAIDEMADLMMTTALDVERQICRLAQMSRATGIHLVLATQRPSVDVITGLIKANFPARIAFAVTTQVDSRVILDVPGAEKLLGRGDMLYMAPDSAKLSRLQGCFVSDPEIDAIVRFWQDKSHSLAAATDSLAVPPWEELAAEDKHDELLEQALQIMRAKSTVSTSLLQRQLRIGYPRAARLMEQLESMGAVGPDEGAGRSRVVLLGQAGRESGEVFD